MFIALGCIFTKSSPVLKTQHFPIIFSEGPVFLLQQYFLQTVSSDPRKTQMTSYNGFCSTAAQPCGDSSLCQVWCEYSLNISNQTAASSVRM